MPRGERIEFGFGFKAAQITEPMPVMPGEVITTASDARAISRAI